MEVILLFVLVESKIIDYIIVEALFSLFRMLIEKSLIGSMWI